MTNQEKSAYLKKYLTFGRTIDQLEDELLGWKDRATRISPEYSGMPHGSNGEDKLQTAVAEMDRIVGELKDQISKAIEIRRAVMKVLSTIENDTLRQIMIYKYVQGKKWEEIAVLMNYEYHYILRLHGKALNAIKKEDIERYIEPVL